MLLQLLIYYKHIKTTYTFDIRYYIPTQFDHSKTIQNFIKYTIHYTAYFPWDCF